MRKSTACSVCVFCMLVGGGLLSVRADALEIHVPAGSFGATGSGSGRV